MSTSWFPRRRGPSVLAQCECLRLSLTVFSSLDSVLKVFSQVAGTDFGSTYAPVCRIPSVRIVLAIAASHDWNVIQLDVHTAFLQSEMKEEVYVKQPVGFEKLT